jgi:hypothetical protein
MRVFTAHPERERCGVEWLFEYRLPAAEAKSARGNQQRATRMLRTAGGWRAVECDAAIEMVRHCGVASSWWSL